MFTWNWTILRNTGQNFIIPLEPPLIFFYENYNIMIKRLFSSQHSETLLLLACLWDSWIKNCPLVHDQKKTKIADSHSLAKVVAYPVSPSVEPIILLVRMEVSNLVKRFTKKQNSCLELLAQCLMQNMKKNWSLQTILPTTQLSLVIIKLSNS